MTCLEIEVRDHSEHVADLIQIPRSGTIVEAAGGQVYREQ